jgi:23S rRNA (guanosine2251-2'-O)-methyltransferase
MVGRRRKPARKLSGSHQRCWIWGRHAVIETLAAGRWIPLELRVSERLDPSLEAELEQLAAAAGVPVTRHPPERLTGWCGTSEHQGLLAQMPPYPLLEADAALADSPASPLYLILDRVQDPHNFGAILRSAEVFGVDAVFVGETQQCEITPHVARSSAGAVNYLNIGQAPDLAELLETLNHRGFVTAAAARDGAVSLSRQDFLRPSAIVIGNEGRGVAEELLRRTTVTISIPQAGQIDSLNAAVAAGIILYEAQRQRTERG